jgi:hypothetical protein
VSDLQIEYASLALRAATFGRGLWTSLLAGAVFSTPVISGPLNPVLSQANAYSFTPVTKALSYQWLQAMLLPFNLVDGAENGLVNFTVNISGGYNLFSTTVKASGNDAFHFTHANPADQLLTLNSTLLVQNNSALQFSSLLGYATSGQVAKVQVSTNSGATWQDVYSQPGGTFETVFSTRSVSLAAFAGQLAQVRFNYHYVNGQSYYPQTGDYFGWYVDNITFTNLQTLTNQIITPVASGTNFIFTPAQAGNYLLQVEAVSYGPAYMGYGAPIYLTAGANTNPILMVNLSGHNLTLSWSDPTFSLQQSPGLAPSAWVTLSSNSPAVFTIGSPGNMFYRLKK